MVANFLGTNPEPIVWNTICEAINEHVGTTGFDATPELKFLAGRLGRDIIDSFLADGLYDLESAEMYLPDLCLCSRFLDCLLACLPDWRGLPSPTMPWHGDMPVI